MVDKDCIFCKIAASEIPSETVYEDSDFRVILDLGPVEQGHMLILPKEHYADISKLDPKLAQKILALGIKMGEAAERGLQATGFNIVLNTGESAGQTIFHCHTHIIPRYRKEKVLDWESKESNKEELAQIANKIRGEL
jgi:bis(5'-nucleosyl)-tetraphosphatase (symmetrical)